MRSKLSNWCPLVGVVGMICLLLPASRGLAAGPLAIQNAKIFTVAGEPIESGTILIRDGVIEAVGENVEVPGEARVIDGEGMVVMPGYIDAHSSSGMSQANEQNSVVPFLSVVDSIDPIATYFEECLRNGVTTAAVSPGNSTLIGGKAAIVKTAGQYVNDMIVVRDSALKISLSPVSGSRMSHMARLRKELDKAKKELEEADESEEDSDADEETDEGRSDKESGDDKKADSDEKEDADSEAEKAVAKPEDEGMAALKQALSGEMPVYLYCEVAMDVTAALRLVEDYELEPIFILGRECHKAAKLLAASGKTAILDPTLVYWETDPRTREDRKIVLPEIYSDAGLNYIFQVSPSSSRGTVGSSYFWYQAATAVKYGLPEEKALAALTLEPAKLLGIDESVGSIEVGKDADLVVLTGEPLDMASWVQYTIVGGEIVYDRDEDEKLERLLSPTAE